MNIQCILWIALLGYKYLNGIKMEGTNLSFKTKDKASVLNQPEQQPNINTTVQRSHSLVYTADFLKSIKCKVDHDQRYKLLHPNVCSTVRKLK